jgi:3-hydroxyacyl-CoA dehydrogenase
VTSEVHVDRRDRVAVLTLDRPVANILAPSLRAALARALERAAADPATEAVVIRGAGAGFSTGLDLAEYDDGPGPPGIGDLAQSIEEMPKPVVAALHGQVLGAAAELALAAHARVAAQDAQIGLPEVTLGLLPCGGTTQRLPRLAGAQVALELLLSGRTVAASDPRAERLLDEVVAQAPQERAEALARDLARSGGWRRSRDRTRGLSDPAGYQKAVAAVAARLEGRDRAEADIVKCIEAALLLPFTRGVELEAALFADRVGSPRARALRHAVLAERRAAVMPEQRQATAREIGRVALLGRPRFLAEMATAWLAAGHTVTLAGGGQDDAAQAAERVAAEFEAAIARQEITEAEAKARLSRLDRAAPGEAVAGADLVLDDGTVAVMMGGRPVAWAVLDPMLALRARADAVGAGARALSLRLYPVQEGRRLAEIGVPAGAAAESVVSLSRACAGLGWTVVRAAAVPGLAGANLAAALSGAALRLVEAGHTPAEVDAAARHMGFRAGPFAMMDAEGLEAARHRLARLAGGAAAGGPGQDLLAARSAAGHGGRAAGRGFYIHDGGAARPDPELPAWLDNWRADRGLPSAPADDQEPGEALHAALVNAAARLIADGVVQRASDVDVLMVRGYGFDRARGGPLFQADLAGTLTLMTTMKRFAALDAALWAPHPAIADMFKNGMGFFGRAP